MDKTTIDLLQKLNDNTLDIKVLVTKQGADLENHVEADEDWQDKTDERLKHIEDKLEDAEEVKNKLLGGKTMLTWIVAAAGFVGSAFGVIKMELLEKLLTTLGFN